MKGSRNFYVLTFVYVIIGLYFLIYSDYPLFVLLFLALAGYHFFLARAIDSFKEEGKSITIQESIEKMERDSEDNEELNEDCQVVNQVGEKLENETYLEIIEENEDNRGRIED